MTMQSRRVRVRRHAARLKAFPGKKGSGPLRGIHGNRANAGKARRQGQPSPQQVPSNPLALAALGDHAPAKGRVLGMFRQAAASDHAAAGFLHHQVGTGEVIEELKKQWNLMRKERVWNVALKQAQANSPILTAVTA